MFVSFYNTFMFNYFFSFIYVFLWYYIFIECISIIQVILFLALIFLIEMNFHLSSDYESAIACYYITHQWFYKLIYTSSTFSSYFSLSASYRPWIMWSFLDILKYKRESWNVTNIIKLCIFKIYEYYNIIYFKS